MERHLKNFIWSIPLLIVLMAVINVSSLVTEAAAQGPKLNFWQSLDTDILNKRIANTPVSSNAMLINPVSLAHELAGGSAETPHTNIDLQTKVGDEFDHVIVIVVRDKFLDDSVRGDWHRFEFSRNSRGAWRVTDARKAVRCWRSPTGIYTARQCL